MQHIINKQVIELSLAKQQDAFKIQHIISSHYYTELLPLLEKVFNQYSTEDEVMVLDRLEINLGIILQKDMEKDRWDDSILSPVKRRLEVSLSSFLTDKTVSRNPRLMNDCRQWIFYMEHGYLGWNTLCINEQWHNNVLSTLATDYAGISLLRNLVAWHPYAVYRIAMQHEDDFLINLTTILTANNQQKLIVAIDEIVLLSGKLAAQDNLPLPVSGSLKKMLWQQVITTASNAIDNLSTEKIITALLYQYRAQLSVFSIQRQQETMKAVTAIQPMLQQFFQSFGNDKKESPPFVDDNFKSTNTLDKYEGWANKEDDKMVNKLNDTVTSLSPPTNENTKKGLSGQILPNESTAKDESFTALDDGYAQDKKKQIDSEDEFAKATKKVIESESIPNQKNTGIVLGGTNEIINVNNAASGNMGSNIKNAPNQGITSALSENNAIKMPGNLLLKENPFTENFGDNYSLCNDIPKDGIFIINAGIVLAHSFIGFLFKRLSLVETNNFKDADAQIKAIFLLHYLSTGNTTAAEHELVVCKLLCAYPINSPIPAEQFFLPVELEEANDMLTALLQQWGKLQNTSIAGLRESFLQRKGKIFTKGGRIIIQVEQSTIDILLDYLPWNLSIIKLPWMKGMVQVEWR